jgi:hypothetical protein
MDLVFTAQNYHDLHLKPFAADTAAKTNAAVFAALKPGGLYVIVDHYAVAGSGLAAADSLHRIDPAIVKEEVEAAGFVLEAQSDLLKNDADPLTANVFDPGDPGPHQPVHPEVPQACVIKSGLLAAVLAADGDGGLGHRPAPYTVAPGLFDAAKPDLGLTPGAGHGDLHRLRDRARKTDHFSNGVSLIAFRGRLYAQWQSSPRDEDSPDTRVMFASSADGEHWTAPVELAPPGAGRADGVERRLVHGRPDPGRLSQRLAQRLPVRRRRSGGEYRASTDGERLERPAVRF